MAHLRLATLPTPAHRRRLRAALCLTAVVLGFAGIEDRAEANDSIGSELSHLLSGAAIAAGATAVADHYGAGENRGWIGFGTSVGISFVMESAQIIANGSSQVRGSSLDFASNLVGAAFGAWVTDRYILAPVVTRDASGHNHFGVTLKMDF